MGLRALLLLLAFLFWTGPQAQAKPAEESSLIPLADVIAAALKKRPGKFLEAELEETHSGRIYEIEILGKDHVIYKLKFRAETGQFLSEEED